jgi:hypothetical protein
MSASLRERPNCCDAAKCREVPESDIDALFDHFVGAQQKRFRQLEAERLGGLLIDDEFEPGWQLDRQVSGFRALENEIDVCRGAPKQRGCVVANRQQPPLSAK